jgi:surface polysaccharide O-acyltransferase-like enzyme
VVRRWALAIVLVLAVTVGLAGAWTATDASLQASLGRVVNTSYYGLAAAVYAPLLFVGFHSLLAAVWPLTKLTIGRAARIGRYLGDATLGVFAFHLIVMMVLEKSGLLGVERYATSGAQLLARYGVVLVVTYVLVLGARRVPFLRRVF